MDDKGHTFLKMGWARVLHTYTPFFIYFWHTSSVAPRMAAHLHVDGARRGGSDDLGRFTDGTLMLANADLSGWQDLMLHYKLSTSTLTQPRVARVQL
jgi:hypothetical protein